jgi:hypothetical protein
LPPGAYRAEWIGPLTGEVAKTEDFQHQSGPKQLSPPEPGKEVALKIKRR